MKDKLPIKIKDMTLQQKREYNRKKLKEWRLKNPHRNKQLRKNYKQSEKGKEANKKYCSKYFKTYSKTDSFLEGRRIYFRNLYNLYPEKFKKTKQYIKDYFRDYYKNEENRRKILVRNKDRRELRKQLIKTKGFCSFCGSTQNLEMHHKTYDIDSEIILLCRPCHRKLHRKPITKREEKIIWKKKPINRQKELGQD